MKLLNNVGRLLSVCLTVFIFTVTGTGCSDNVVEGLIPSDKSDIQAPVASFPAASDFNNNVLTVGAAETEIDVEVTAKTRWYADIENASWCSIDYPDTGENGEGFINDGSFTIRISSNLTSEERSCTLSIYAIERDGTPIDTLSNYIEIIQVQPKLSIEPSQTLYNFPSDGGKKTITVNADQEWRVSSTNTDWVTIVPGDLMNKQDNSFTPASGSNNETRESFEINVAPNTTSSSRTAEVLISSPTNAFTVRRISLRQEEALVTFFVTPDAVSPLPSIGREIEFQVYSPVDNWTVRTAENWIKLDTPPSNSVTNTLTSDSVAAKAEPVTVKFMVLPNNSTSEREGNIVFTTKGNTSIITISIKQTGVTDTKPAVSTAWIADGWTATKAELHAYYILSNYTVTGCGAYYQSTNGGELREVISGKHENGLITVNMEGLEQDTEYAAWGYIQYEEGETLKIEKSNLPVVFKTLSRDEAGTTPGAGDNTPPETD